MALGASPEVSHSQSNNPPHQRRGGEGTMGGQPCLGSPLPGVTLSLFQFSIQPCKSIKFVSINIQYHRRGYWIDNFHVLILSATRKLAGFVL